MAQVVEITGKTVAEALASAVKQLGCTENDVDYEVLEAPSKGFLGLFGVKPAKIKVTRKEKAVESVASVTIEDVKEDDSNETVRDEVPADIVESI